MGSRFLSMVMLVVTFGVLTACETDQPMTFNTQPVPILQSYAGNDASLPGPDVIVVNSAAQLPEGSELAGQNIDFSRRSLVIVTLGERPTGGYGVRIHGVQRHNNTLYVQGVETQPGSDAVVTQALTHPYAAVEVEKLPAGLIVQPEIEEVSAGR